MQSRRNPGPEPDGTTAEGAPAVDGTLAMPTGAEEGGTAATRRFPASCESVREARWFVRDHLRGDAREDLEPVALMLSELATNAVQHADSAFDVGVTVSPGARGRLVHVRVTDESPGFPVPQEPLPDGPHGRGLRIVESLAEAWGIEVQQGRAGKAVWFTSLLEASLRAAPTSGPDRASDVVRGKGTSAVSSE